MKHFALDRPQQPSFFARFDWKLEDLSLWTIAVAVVAVTVLTQLKV